MGICTKNTITTINTTNTTTNTIITTTTITNVTAAFITDSVMHKSLSNVYWALFIIP